MKVTRVGNTNMFEVYCDDEREAKMLMESMVIWYEDKYWPISRLIHAKRKTLKYAFFAKLKTKEDGDKFVIG